MIAPVEVTNGTIHVIVQQTFDSPFTIILAISTLGLAIVTGIGLWRTLAATRRSNKELVTSNELTRDSNELLRTDIYARVKPLLRIHNTGHEPIETYDQKIVEYHPNLRNDGMIEASHLRINYKVMEKEVDLEEIIRKEKEVERQSIPYDGSISASGGIAVLNAVNLPLIDKTISIVLWINYKFLDDVEDTIIFNIICNGTGNYFHGVVVKNYTISDIKRVRKEIKIKESGASIG